MDANFDVDDFGRVESGIVPTFADQELSPSSSESIEKYDIWAQPKSPCGISIPSTISGDPDSDFLSKVEAELACFKAGQRLEMDGDLFSWWNENIGRLPELSKLARMVHSIPATSVSSERLFSKAGLIFANSLRNRLSGQTVRQILIVKANLDALLLAPANELESDDESEEKCDF
ncbi:hypothetical protein niasHT_008794 [Heterodera trifolii]|uniref:HAT C-terminal dimerisation domain-containing protein n=1 Tax=Heterodera trifolii TaxID=157864 RepID=A0ABD2M5V4_9BILA